MTKYAVVNKESKEVSIITAQQYVDNMSNLMKLGSVKKHNEFLLKFSSMSSECNNFYEASENDIIETLTDEVVDYIDFPEIEMIRKIKITPLDKKVERKIQRKLIAENDHVKYFEGNILQEKDTEDCDWEFYKLSSALTEKEIKLLEDYEFNLAIFEDNIIHDLYSTSGYCFVGTENKMNDFRSSKIHANDISE